VVLGTKVGRAKHLRIMPGGALETEDPNAIFVGRKLDEHRGAFFLEYPMEQGAITETGWDAMERLWDVSVCVYCALHPQACLFLFFAQHSLEIFNYLSWNPTRSLIDR
jgi:actin-related protein